MKYFFSIIFLLTFAVGITAAEKSPELTAAQFYNEKAAALSITQPVLRTMKLLALLEKCPSRADELYTLLKDQLAQTEFPPQIKALALQILEKNPGSPTINYLLYHAYGEAGILIEKWKKMLLLCPTENLTQLQEKVILIASDLVYKHFSGQSRCRENRDFFIKMFDRFNAKQYSTVFRALLLYTAMDFHRQCIWEYDCISPHGKFWKKLPAEGDKMLYLEARRKLFELEKEIQFPLSLELLRFYNRHYIDRAADYAGNFLGSRDEKVIDLLLSTAEISGNRQLFDHCIKFFTDSKNEAKYAPLMPLIAVCYASNFQDYTLLEKYASPEEIGFIKAVKNKNFPTAESSAENLLKSGKITCHAVIRTMVELVWQTKNKQLLKKIFDILETNPKLLNAENANAVAYTAAVLNIELEKAEKFSRIAFEKLPDSHAVVDTLAYTLYRRKNFAEAHKLITDAEKMLSPGDSCAPLYLHAAEIELAHTKDKVKAKHFFNRALLASRDNDEEFDYDRAAELREILK